jgi:hypothetical protein
MNSFLFICHDRTRRSACSCLFASYRGLCLIIQGVDPAALEAAFRTARVLDSGPPPLDGLLAIAVDGEVHPNQIHSWKKQLWTMWLERLAERRGGIGAADRDASRQDRPADDRDRSPIRTGDKLLPRRSANEHLTLSPSR